MAFCGLSVRCCLYVAFCMSGGFSKDGLFVVAFMC